MWALDIWSLISYATQVPMSETDTGIGSNVPSTRNPVVDEDRMRPGH